MIRAASDEEGEVVGLRGGAGEGLQVVVQAIDDPGGGAMGVAAVLEVAS